jgi:hypothetical protein
MLVQFADSVLPGIVKGFAAFTGGFFSGLGTSLKSLDHLSGPNWKSIGDTMGKITGELILLLPKLIEIAGWLINMANTIAKLPGGIGLIVGAWVTFKAVMAFGQFATGLSMIFGGVTKIGGALTKLAGLDVGAVFTNAMGPLTSFAALLNPLTAALALIAGPAALVLHGTPGQRANELPNYARLMASRGAGNEAFASRFGAGGTQQSLMEQQQAASALQRSAQMLSGGIGYSKGASGGAITINSTTNYTVAGGLSPEAIAQVELLHRQDEQRLVQRLQQTRGAYG